MMKRTHVPCKVTGSTELRGAQCSRELSLKSTDFRAPENLIFPALVTHLYMSLFSSLCLSTPLSVHPSVRPSVCPSIHCAPYLRNRTLSNHKLWYTCVNDDISTLFFKFFEILIFWAVRGVKGEKIAQNEK